MIAVMMLLVKGKSLLMASSMTPLERLQSRLARVGMGGSSGMSDMMHGRVPSLLRTRESLSTETLKTLRYLGNPFIDVPTHICYELCDSQEEQEALWTRLVHHSVPELLLDICKLVGTYLCFPYR
jgi:hypothetical protein